MCYNRAACYIKKLINHYIANEIIICPKLIIIKLRKLHANTYDKCANQNE